MIVDPCQDELTARAEAWLAQPESMDLKPFSFREANFLHLFIPAVAKLREMRGS